MRVYKFLDTHFGLKSLSEKRLKISMLSDLNDPFELIPYDISDREHRRALQMTRSQLARHRGMLCFSADWRDPVLWAHYSDKHRGFCLGFELADELCHRVKYVFRRMPFPHSITAKDAEVAEAILFTKYSNWQYEQEVRVFLELNDQEGGIYFREFCDSLRLVMVIAGARNTTSKSEIERALGDLAPNVELVKARPGFTDFEIVRDQRGFR
jgi:hypothetical protein